MSSPDNPESNRLLAALPNDDFRQLVPHLERFPMRLGETLYRPGEPLQHAYFPTTAIVSVLYVMESGASAEIASVGNEGVLGISLFMGGITTPSSAVVQTPGLSHRIKANLLQDKFNRGGNTRQLLLRYTEALAVQIGLTASCNRHHSVEQQLCRWLLTTLDRLPLSEVVMTHEQMAGILGVRRESITAAAGKLQRAGVLSYRRGHITVVERLGLEAVACECYTLVKHEYSRLRADAPSRHRGPTANGHRELNFPVDNMEPSIRAASPDSRSRA
jgi:CRP-like cAMP-binding protein